LPLRRRTGSGHRRARDVPRRRCLADCRARVRTLRRLRRLGARTVSHVPAIDGYARGRALVR
jgi:hypothetical protein